MSDYDQRQFKVMLHRLNAFDSKAVSLHKLIADLEGLMRSLQDTDKTWTDAFYKQWSILEEVYAYALHKGFKQFPSDDWKKIAVAVEELRHLVESRIAATDTG